MSKFRKNLILVPIERCSVVLRHANRLFSKLSLYNFINDVRGQGVEVRIVNKIPCSLHK